MKLQHHYLRLHALYGAQDELEVTLDELASALGCTHRSAVSIISAMHKQEWIAWRAQRGRGRHSCLRFLAPPEEIAVQTMMQAVTRRQMKPALDRLQDLPQASTPKERMQGWLQSYFGHIAELKDDHVIDTLRIPIREPLVTLDPLHMNLLVESFVVSHVFEGLVRRNRTSGAVEPNMAIGWETNSDRTAWTFYLRKGMEFHHGRTVTASDIAFSFERLRDSAQGMLYGFVVKHIQSVTALNALTVRFQLSGCNELFLPFLSTSRASIIPSDIESQGGKERLAARPLGTGPFQVKERTEGVCVLEAFPRYFRGRAQLDRVEIIHVPAEADGGTSPFHIIHNPSTEDGQWSRMQADVSVRKFITCNTDKPGSILSNPSLRAQVLEAAAGAVTENQGLLRIEGANERRPLQLLTIPSYRADADRVAAALLQAGFPCTLVIAEPEAFKGAVRFEADIILFAQLRDQDEELRRYELYATIAGHIEQDARTEVERWLQAVVMEPEEALRLSYLDQAEAALIEGLHFLILHERPLQTAYLPTVRGVTFNAQGWVDLRHLWFPTMV